jgi:hypothetical protein
VGGSGENETPKLPLACAVKLFSNPPGPMLRLGVMAFREIDRSSMLALEKLM